MGDRLVVDLDLLERTGAEIGELTGEIRAQSDIVQDARSAVGHHGLSDALADFAGNWSYHRQKLTGALESIGEMAASCAEVYRSTDEQLAEGARGHGG